MIRVMLLDDHAVVRNGYRQWIDAQPDMRVVVEAATTAQACEAVRDHDIDVAVVDISLKADSGIEAMRRMRERKLRLRMVVFTMHEEPGYALQALKVGASGYITKDSDPALMLEAIREVAAGRHLFASTINEAWLRQAAQGDAGPLAQLTPREFEVLRLTTEGLDMSAVAQALHISEKTVHNTMSLIRQKLDERNDFRLMRLAAKNGLIRLGKP